MGLQNKLMHYLFILTFLFFGTSVLGQDTTLNWIAYPAEESLEKLKVYEKLYDQVSNPKWPEADRIAYLKKGFEAARDLQTFPEAIRFSQRLGNHYHTLDSFAQAIQYIQYPVRLKYDTLSVARAYNRLGYLYFDVGDYKNALQHFFEAARYGKMLHNGWETYPFGNITNIYKRLEDYDNAIKYAKASLAIDAQADFPEREYGLVYNYTNLMIFHQKKEQFDSCWYYIGQIKKNIEPIDTIDNVNYRQAIQYALAMMGDFYLQQNDLSATRRLLDQALAHPSANRSVELLNVVGKFHLKVLDFTKALEAIRALEALNSQNFGDIEDLLRLKIDYYTATGDLREALRLQQSFIETQRSKFGDDRLRYSAFANAEFKNLEQQQQIRALENQQQMDRLYARNRAYFLLLIFIVVLGATSFLGYRYRQNKQLSRYLDEQIRLKTKDLEQANLELRTINYIASHDIKEPIRNIGNYAGMIYKRLPHEHQVGLGDYFTIIKNGTRQLYTLIEDFSQYTSLSSAREIEWQWVDLNELVGNLVHGMGSYILSVNGKVIHQGLPKVYSNSSLLFIILKNLIENGLKFNQSSKPVVTLSAMETPSHLQIIVKDNGIGIEQPYHDQVFEMFSRLHDRGQYEGSGIGLAIVKLLCNKLNAEIALESAPGEGSTFTLKLPA